MNLRIVVPCLLLSPALLVAAEFWQDKDPSQWTEKEFARLRENSPWSHDASVHFNMGQMGGMPGGRGGMGGPGGGMGRGGGMGGPGGAPPEMEAGGPAGGMSSPTVLVRWESAAPLLVVASRGGQEDTPQAIAKWAHEYYVISVSGLSAPGGRGAGQEPADGQEVRTARGSASLIGATWLKRKGKEAVNPDRVETLQTAKGPVTFFLFSRSAPIETDDKEVTFESGMGPLGIQCKFVLKGMTYHGKLAL